MNAIALGRVVDKGSIDLDVGAEDNLGVVLTLPNL